MTIKQTLSKWKAWIWRSAISLLALLLLAVLVLPFLLYTIPDGDDSVARSPGKENVAASNVASVTVTATPDYRPDDSDWQRPSPVPVPVHVTSLVVLLSVILAWMISKLMFRRVAHGWLNPAEPLL